MNTYASFAFTKNINKPKILYQFHPHANFVKDILEEEMKINPKAANSILKEYEFSLNEKDLAKLIEESKMADHILCASTITKRSLLLEGIDEKKFTVIPYGVDQHKFPYMERKGYNKTKEGNFRVLFVGSLNQRKGITYLLDALSNIKHIELVIVGRGIFDEELLRGLKFKFTVHKDIASSQMVELMHSCHCLVLPSIIEGFGQVILEAMSTGLPVIASCNTVAADIINEDNGFVVPIRDPDAIRNCIKKLMDDTEMYVRISVLSYQTSKGLSWGRFRREIADKVETLSNIES